MYTGFRNIDLPEYEVITPHTKYSFTVKSLNVQKERRLKGSFVTPSKITEHLNKIIWESIVKKPDEIKTYEDFLSKLTLKDRDALMYGLYHISYGEVNNYLVPCPSCKKEYPITVQISSTFNFNSYPYDDILTKIVKVPLPIMKSVFAHISQPTLIDEINALKNISGDSELISSTLYIKKFTQENEGGDEILIYSDRNDILDAYNDIASKDKNEILDKYVDNFGQYGIELKCKTYCQYCNVENDIDIDLVEQFFRNAFGF